MLKNYWYVAATSGEIGAQPLARTILGESVVLFRTVSGQIAALADVCPHRRAPLSMGHVIGETIACPYHGIQYSRTGACERIPAQSRIPPSLKAHAYAVIERYGMVWIWPGDGEPEAELPALPWREDKAWNAELTQYLHVRAPAELVTNNLLDLSHVAFVHARTIAFAQDRLAEDPLVVETFGDKVRCTRVFKDVEPPPAHRIWRDFKGLVDRSSISEWQRPGNVLILVRNEDADGALDLRFDHFITPESETSHHYFVAISRNFLIDDTVLTGKLDAENAKVHDEDREMVEAQHKTILAHPQMRDMNLRQDQAIARAQAIMAGLHKLD
ncbi:MULTISPECIES: aromatic ring-hydroxylating dioxygenase subunit alpha [unclassified Beijerinckia]|uniref:aromatic ring-hydroxylating dioxygenase subunit alpha n=1 Tax=unclassified Beijerinckia TaxID=2638183 RepID=UPI0008969405|nr:MULTISPECIES: aromatic ring-hydroxylating dioxygenase subunit alpha [unclassified Beijerinckia]MDH7798580.1 vanillate O-demethylase monooxygenase subunit [Beijerinckia sp. GAS462]SED25607.1 vanillate O-demethylase monooxygenase subunit [Beijerinckia sp. 28-YEA-48]